MKMGLKIIPFFVRLFFIGKNKIESDCLLIILGWAVNSSEQMMLAFTIQSSLKIRLPAGHDNTSVLKLTIQIRDVLNCVTEFIMKSIVVTSDQIAINTLIDVI